MTANIKKINAKTAFSYILLPGIIPRAGELLAGSFGYLAFLFAHLFQAVRILPPLHPHTQAGNIGTFSIMDVLSAASNHIVFSRKNADQITIFFLILAALALFLLQAVLFLLSILMGKALAGGGGGPPSFTSMFQTPNPQTDIAFLMLDYVFGIPGSGGGNSSFFGSNALNASSGPTPFHQAMHALFEFYNYAILLIAVVIFLYYVFVVVIETAQTGVPFGARFSKIYAPLRLIAAIGLLIPLNYGFNAAQYITLTAAKLGSSFATNGWTLYNRVASNPAGVPNTSMVARVNVPEINALVHFGSVYHACREIYKIYVPKRILESTTTAQIEIKPYVIVNNVAQEFSGYSYEQAKRDFGTGVLSIVLGELDLVEHRNFAGGVRPYCGVININLNNNNPQGFTGNADRGGVRQVELAYFTLIRQILDELPDNMTKALGERSARGHVPLPNVSNGGLQDPCYNQAQLGDGATCGRPHVFPQASALQDEIDTYNTNLRAMIRAAYTNFRSSLNLQLPAELVARGWGGAGIWYNRIAEINGAFTGSIYAAPNIASYPEVMQFILDRKREADTNSTACKLFDPNLANNRAIEFPNAHDRAVATATVKMYEYWACTRPGESTAIPRGMTCNPLVAFP